MNVFPLYYGKEKGFFLEQGIDLEIELVSLGDCYGDLNCFTAGQIDAGFIGEPKVTQGEHLGLFKVLARVGDYFPKYQWGVIFARNDFIEKQPELLARILVGFRNACRYIQENPEQTIELGSKIFDVSTEVFRGALHRDLANWEVDAKVDIKGLNNCLKIQAEAGAITCDIGNLEMVCHL
jgi:ABC-type nitrate/sulfonate/bicarbonate transport system substrate-binding protein